MSTAGFLDKDDLRKMTHAAYLSSQEEWLKAEGIPYKRTGRNLLVLWAHVRNWVEGRPSVSLVEPDFSSLER